MKKSKIWIVCLLFILSVMMLTGCSKSSYSSKQITKYLKEKYDQDDIELISEEQLEDIEDKAKDRHIYTYKAGNVEFSVEVELYRYDENIAYTKKAISNYHRKIVMENDEIRSKIEESGFEWCIEDDSYVISWSEYEQLDELVKLLDDIIEMQEPITDLDNKHISDSHALVYVDVMEEKDTFFSFSVNVPDGTTSEERYEILVRTYQGIAERWQDIEDYKRAVMESEEIRQIY